ncbi:MAG: hypothetical protein ACSLE1_02975 [Sphingobium sp.]
MSSAAAIWAASNGGSLDPLRLLNADLAIGVAATINIVGATPTSALSATGLPVGFTLNSAARTITGTPTSRVLTTFTLTETLPGKANSPNSTGLGFNVLSAPFIRKTAGLDIISPGESNFGTAFRQAVEYDAGKLIQLVPGADYEVSDQVAPNAGINTTIDFAGARIWRANDCGIFVSSGVTQYKPAFLFVGGFEWVRSVSAINIVSTSVVSEASGSTNVAQMVMADISGIEVGDVLRAFASNFMTHGDRSSTTGDLYPQCPAEGFPVLKVEATGGGAGLVYTGAPFRVDLLTNIRVAKYKKLRVEARNLAALNDHDDAPLRRGAPMIEFRAFQETVLEDLKSDYVAGHFLRTMATYRVKTKGIAAKKCVTSPAANTFGYAHQIYGDTDGYISEMDCGNDRHGPTTAGFHADTFDKDSMDPEVAYLFGGCVGTTYHAGVSNGGQNSGFDWHGDARYCVCINPVVTGGFQGASAAQYALQMRGYRNTIINPRITGPGAVTIALQGNGAGEHSIEGLSYYKPAGYTNTHPPIRITSEATTELPNIHIDGTIRSDSALPGFVIEADRCHVTLSNRTEIDVILAPATFGRGGIIDLANGATVRGRPTVDFSRSATANTPMIAHVPAGCDASGLSGIEIIAGAQAYFLAAGYDGSGNDGGGAAIFNPVSADKAPFHNGASTVRGYYKYLAGTASWANILVTHGAGDQPARIAATYAAAGLTSVTFDRCGSPIIEVVPKTTVAGVILGIDTRPLYEGQRLRVHPATDSTQDVELANTASLPAHKSLGISVGDICEYVGIKEAAGTLIWSAVRTVTEKVYYVGASTSSLAEVALKTLRVPGGAMGTAGQIVLDAYYTATGAANTKTAKCRLTNGSGTTIASRTMTAAQAALRYNLNVSNAGATNAQVAQSASADYGPATTGVTATVDTTSAFNILLIGNVADAADACILQRVSLRLAA